MSELIYKKQNIIPTFLRNSFIRSLDIPDFLGFSASANKPAIVIPGFVLDYTIRIERVKIKCKHSRNCLKRLYFSSSVKWSDPGHILESQGKFFLSFPCTIFLHVFDI